MQWGDLDSASVLRDWLEQPLAAPVIIVLSYRSEEIQTSSSLALLLDEPERQCAKRQITIDLEPLRAERRAHAVHASPGSSARTRQKTMIERIVQEAHGNPFLAQQLTAIAEAKLARHDTSLDGLSMEALVQRASTVLGDSARALLNVLAIAGRPLQPQLALGTQAFSARAARTSTRCAACAWSARATSRASVCSRSTTTACARRCRRR